MSYYLSPGIDFDRHNDEVRKLWAAYEKNEHPRIPVVINGSIRNLLSNPELNSTGYGFRDFFTRPEAHIRCQLEYDHYCRHHLVCDRIMGNPEREWQLLRMDFQNSFDQGWFGCPLTYFSPTDVPDTTEILKENPKQLYDWEDPDPFLGRGDFMKNALEMYERIREICRAGYEFQGLPVKPPAGFQHTGTDGVFSVALKLRGTVECMVDMYENPEYFHALMDYITRNLIARIKAHREWSWDRQGISPKAHRGAFFYADDSIAMLSPAEFQQFVAPYLKRLYDEFSDGSGIGIHLCGNATHHFQYLKEKFHAKSFDTGFPVDHGRLRRELGPEVQIFGGPTIMLVKEGPPEEIDAEVRKICESGVLAGGRFVLIAANNLAPCTPVENIRALYEAGKKYGVLKR